MTILFDEEKQDHKLDEINKREQEDIAQILADRYGITYADLGVAPINMDALRLIPEKEARDAKVAAFSMVGERLKVAVLSPANEKLPKVFVGTKANMLALLLKHKDNIINNEVKTNIESFVDTFYTLN